MAFVYGTISDASPGATLYTAIADGLSSEGFTLVDTVVISTRTHKVWKCPAANNSHNLDWYLDVVYSTTGAGNMWFAPFEHYDPATHLGYRGPYIGGGGAAPVDVATFSRYGSTGYALETNWNTISAGISFLTSTSSFGYWISIKPDRIIGLSSAGVNDLLYTGFYNPHPLHIAAVGESSVYPLVSAKLHNNADSSTASGNGECAFTRIPGMSTSGTYGYAYYLSIKTRSVADLLFMPSLPSGNLSSFSARGASPVLLTTYSNDTINNVLWGTLPDIATARTPSTVVRGDTTTISSDPWILTSSSGTGSNIGYSLLFRA